MKIRERGVFMAINKDMDYMKSQRPKMIGRPPERIDGFLEEFKKAWKEAPDLRFGQLVVVLLGLDPFYIEDDEALERIKERWKN